MKKLNVLFAAVLVLMTIFPTDVKAEEILNIKATAYCYNSGFTATGTVPKEGRTLAGRREWFGKTIVVWEDKGNGIEPENYIGTFVCEDTGGKPIRQGYVIDIFIEDEGKAIQFGCKDVIVILLDAEG